MNYKKLYVVWQLKVFESQNTIIEAFKLDDHNCQTMLEIIEIKKKNEENGLYNKEWSGRVRSEKS